MARWLSMMLVTLMLGVTACQSIRAPAPVISTDLVLSPPATPVSQYGGIELSLNTTATVENPYDPAQIDLRVHFTAPDGQVLTVPAFWMQDFDPVTLRPSGEPGWRVRFTPHLPGEWFAQAELVGQNQRSAQLSFPVAPSDHPGFMRIHPQNPRYFAFEDGSLYFPIGLNLGWAGQDVLGDYTRWFDRLSANGGNVARIWITTVQVQDGVAQLSAPAFDTDIAAKLIQK